MDVVEELLKRGVSVIAFDPVGQWTGFQKKCDDKGMLSRYKKFGMSGARGFDVEIIKIDQLNLDFSILPYMKRKGLTVVRLDGLQAKDADTFIEQSLEKIYRAGLSETSSLKTLLVLDEVHRLLPKYGGRKAYLKLEQAVREFRKWGIGLLMISQVLTDFKGAIRGNIGTEIQMHSRYEGDIKRVKERHGAAISQLIAKMPIGLGMIESGSYNRGSPYFVEFRPLLHSPLKPSDAGKEDFWKKDEKTTFDKGSQTPNQQENKEEDKPQIIPKSVFSKQGNKDAVKEEKVDLGDLKKRLV